MTLVPDRIRWHEDMLVTTRHVEALSARLEALVRTLPGRHHPFPWGVMQADVVLDDPLIAVKGLDAVMPNGVPVLVEAARPLELDLRPFLAASRRRRFFVHLGTPLDEQEGESFPRFVLDGTGEIVGDDAVPAERRPSPLTLIAGEVPPESRLASFPLLEISTDGPTLALTEFIPPLLQVAPPRPIATRCASVSDRLRRDVAALVNAAREEVEPPFSSAVRSQVSHVVAALPAFEVLLASRPHPLALYLELCRVAAAAATLRNRVTPPTFPAYNHDDLRGTFEPVLRFALGEGEPSSGPIPSFAFEREGRWFRLPPDQGWTDALAAGSSAELILAMKAFASEAKAAQWGAHCVIASRSEMGSQLARRVHGVGRRRVSPPRSMPLEEDVYLFRLDVDPELIKPGEDLLVLGDLPSMTPNALTLYVVDREGMESNGERA